MLEELKDLKNASTKQQDLIYKLEREVVETKEELKRIIKQLETTTRNAITPLFTGNSQALYADVLCTPPDSLKSTDVPTSPHVSRALFCTIDVSRVPVEESNHATPGVIRTAVENEVHVEKESPAWRCRAVTRDVKAPHRSRIVCRDEEHRMIKGIAERKLPQGV